MSLEKPILIFSKLLLPALCTVFCNVILCNQERRNGVTGIDFFTVYNFIHQFNRFFCNCHRRLCTTSFYQRITACQFLFYVGRAVYTVNFSFFIPAAFAAASAPKAVGSFPPKMATTSGLDWRRSSAIPIATCRFPFASCCPTTLKL